MTRALQALQSLTFKLNSFDQEKIAKFFAYVEKTWVGSVVPNKPEDKRSEPRFAVKLWNQHEAALNVRPRTNNSSEGSYFFIHNIALKCICKYNKF